MIEQKEFNGERLKNARLYRGLTLTELAKQTDISKQSLSLYENNRNTPEHLKVKQLSTTLGFPYDFFFQEDKSSAKTETTYFRSFASANKKERTAQSIKLEYVAKIYKVLIDYIEFPKINLPEIEFIGYDDIFDCENVTSVAEIENIANKTREYWKLGEGPIKNLQLVLEENGIQVTGFGTNENKIDAFSQRTIVQENDVFFIAVALGDKPEGRIRFDMSHELGHILMHPWSEDLDAIPSEEFKARERQANMFASAFLLPRESFGKDIQAYPTDLKYYQFLKKKWKVSMQAMVYRAHQLKIITDNQYQYMMRQFSKNGWRVNEPDDVPFLLNANVIRGAIDLLIDQKVLSAKDIMEIFKKRGITLYSEEIEELLNLKEGTLKIEDKVVQIIQLKR
ncbi:MAG: XRE family transcriptional regulator [Herbinix sp.]|nr:XRE family transcriptional regulator [Herbinix sp.]